MPRFAVKFAGPTGKMGSEVIDAANERAAAAQLESSGRTPIAIKAVADSGGSGGDKAGRVRRTKGGKSMRRAVLDFTHQLAAISESGIPIIAGLRAVGDQTEHPKLKPAIARIAARIEGGRSMAEALDAEPDVFSALFVKTLAAGEAGGNIPEVLEALARYQEQEAETRSQIKSAMMYPALVVGALVIATIFMLIFVVPQFATMFEKFEGQLPIPTRILLGTSKAITDHGLIVAGVVVSLILGARKFFSYTGPRAWLDDRILKVPVLGNILVGVYMTRFIDLLGLLNRSALPITQSLRVTADSMTNAALKRDIRGMLRAIEGGRTLGEAFNETRWLTPLVKRMLAIGEHAGRSDQIMAYIGKYYSVQTQRSVKFLSTLIEPMLVGGLAAVVLFFALSIFLPMWKLLKLMGS